MSNVRIGIRVLILAAGKGTRLEGLPKGINKCAFPIRRTASALHTVHAFLAAGVSRFCVVTGYAAKSVEAALEPVENEADISFINNPFFAEHGCNYSLARVALSGCFDRAERLIIAEGDSLLPPSTIEQFVQTGSGNAVLLRSPSFINPARSVVAVGRGGMVTRFAYDTKHKDALAAARLTAKEEVIGESMQLWSFGGTALAELLGRLRRYGREAERGGRPMLDSGVHSINENATPLSPVFATLPDEWINLNTTRDLEKAEACSWLAI